MRRTGDADWRRSSAGCVARDCASMWGAPQRARRPRERPEIRRGYASCRGDEMSRPAHRRTAKVRVSRVGLVGPFGQPRLTYHKGPQTLSATLVCVSGPFLSFG